MEKLLIEIINYVSEFEGEVRISFDSEDRWAIDFQMKDKIIFTSGIDLLICCLSTINKLKQYSHN